MLYLWSVIVIKERAAISVNQGWGRTGPILSQPVSALSAIPAT